MFEERPESEEQFITEDVMPTASDGQEYRYWRSLKRKATIAIFSIAIIIVLPRFSMRYQDFDVVRNSGIFMLVVAIMAAYVFYILTRYAMIPNRLGLSWKQAIKKHLAIIDLVSFLSLLLAFLVVTNAFVFSFASVEGSSMMPTLQAEDSIVINHFNISYNHGDLVVVFIDEDLYFVKRIIGLQGDVISINGDALMINGVPRDEPYLDNGVVTCPTTCEYTVPDGHVFVLGDNRNNSTDSRNETIGYIRLEDLYGRVIFRISPLNHFGRVN